MTHRLAEAFKKASALPDALQNELADQLIEDLENESKWQQCLSQPQGHPLEELACQALDDSYQGKTHPLGFDEL